ncbi:MAG: GNAT family N-acetyltransferase [Oscillochloridaceae bacterium umkhey_bin13]
MAISSAPASAWSVTDLAALFSATFEGYFYPGVTTAAQLAQRIANENLDLVHSPVLLHDGTPIGLALLGRRGSRAWCGGFGIIASQRGHGYAHTLMANLLEQVRTAGASQFSLEVLTRNTPALRVYEQAGLHISRRLLILSWQLGDEDEPAGVALVETDPTSLVMHHFAAMHPVAPAWQREPATLLTLPDLRGLALHQDGGVVAYALVRGDTSLRLYDVAARDEPSARQLLVSLQAQAHSIISVNEPATNPLTAAFLRCGFLVADEQHELVL